MAKPHHGLREVGSVSVVALHLEVPAKAGRSFHMVVVNLRLYSPHLVLAALVEEYLRLAFQPVLHYFAAVSEAIVVVQHGCHWVHVADVPEVAADAAAAPY